MADDNVERSTTDLACPTCGRRGSWSSIGPERIYCPPAGHTVHKLGRDFTGIKIDSCPLTFFVPDLQIDI